MIRLLAIALTAIGVMGLIALAVAPRAASNGARPETVVEAGVGTESPAPLGEQALVLRRDSGGQFHLSAQVNGQDTRFLVDTGADVVALTVEDADALGLGVDPASFEPIMRTASGTGYGARITLDTLALGEAEFQNVPAVVVQGLHVNLLGQNVLRELGRVELSGDRMVIRQR